MPASTEHHADQHVARETARIQLSYTDEGVFIQAPQGAGDIEIASYIKRRGVVNPDMQRAKRQLATGAASALLASAQSEGPVAGDDIYVEFSKDDMTATLFLFPGDEDGRKLSAQEITAALTDGYKIQCGIDEEAVNKVAQQRPYRRPVEIAHGIPPQNGENAKVDFHFRLSTTMRPKLLEGDRVDYRTLDLFEAAKAGQLLVTRTPPTAGEDGQSLRGKPLKARPGRDSPLPRGKGVIIDEDRTSMTAEVDGVVTYKDGLVHVNRKYIVEGNVDMSVGNIDFVGDIEIHGNVIGGMKIKAEGNIEVHGVVEGAALIAGGNVVLRQGMQGTNRGEIRAGGDVISKYFERAKVSAGGVVSADAIYHSEVSAVEAVSLAGKHASLVGGTTRSAKQVAARTIGSASEPMTVIEVGVLPEQRERLAHLEDEIVRLNNEKGKIALLVRSYGGAPQPNESPKRTALRQRVIEANRQMLMSLASATVERDRLKAEMESITSGRVHVTGTIFPGARMVIGAAAYVVDNPIDFATFKVTDGEVGFSSCELS